MGTIRRLLCFVLEHPWRYLTIQPSLNLARECKRCGKRQRKLGTAWLPAGKDFGWIDG